MGGLLIVAAREVRVDVDGRVGGLELEVREMLRNLYNRGAAGATPINPQPHAGRTSLNNILTIAFGTRTDTIDHPLVGHWLKHSREFMYVTNRPLLWSSAKRPSRCSRRLAGIALVPCRTWSISCPSCETSRA